MKKLFFAFATLLAGCQSERVAFQFQPVAPTAAYAPRTAAPQPASQVQLVSPPAAAKPVATTQAASADAPVTGQPLRRPLLPGLHRAARPASVAEGPAAYAPAAAPRPLRQLVLRRVLRRPATHGQARTAESGLGGIALFFLAIALGLLAGLGALVSLIPGISFLGGVGLAAAGLLVIFLLYSLLSGGKKKKPAAK